MTVVFLLTYTLQYIFDKKHKLYSNIENRKLKKLNKLKLRWHGWKKSIFDPKTKIMILYTILYMIQTYFKFLLQNVHIIESHNIQVFLSVEQHFIYIFMVVKYIFSSFS